MDNNELRKILHQLHEEISHTETVDEEGGRLLRDLDVDIRTLLERSEESPLQLHPPLVQRLEGTVYHFEVTHPVLTTIVSRLLDVLSNTGI